MHKVFESDLHCTLSGEGTNTDVAMGGSTASPDGLPNLSSGGTELTSERSSNDNDGQPMSVSPPEHRSEAGTCNSAIFESALQSAFNRTDADFGLLDSAALVGTTAVVSLVGSRQLYIANCGKASSRVSGVVAACLDSGQSTSSVKEICSTI